jgi:hypothetical protein
METKEVETLRLKMIHAVTQYDIKESRKPGYNIYGLPIMLGAVSRTAELLADGFTPRQAILANFNGRLATVVLKSVGEKALTKDEA